MPDEIFSDYGFNGIKHFRHSTIGGKFSENLKEIFPWKNFFDNTQRAYLMKEEYVSGSTTPSSEVRRFAPASAKLSGQGILQALQPTFGI